MRKIYLGIQAEKASHPQMGDSLASDSSLENFQCWKKDQNRDSKMLYQDKLFKYENNRWIFSNMNKLNTQEM